MRGQRVMLDSDLARLYGVTTTQLNQQLARNPERFPEDFAYQLTQQEAASLLSQNATSKPTRGGRRTLPWGNVPSPNHIQSTIRSTSQGVEFR